MAKRKEGKRHSLKRMILAAASANGAGIIFAFETHKGQILECQCPAYAIPEIIARLMGAAELAAQNAGLTKLDLSHAMNVDNYTLSGTRTGQPALLLHLFPAPNCPIGFHLSLELADKLAAELPGALATIRQVRTAKYEGRE